MRPCRRNDFVNCQAISASGQEWSSGPAKRLCSIEVRERRSPETLATSATGQDRTKGHIASIAGRTLAAWVQWEDHEDLVVVFGPDFQASPLQAVFLETGGCVEPTSGDV